ncbi:4-hydroxythreonine-4-phosphate dehydrogenase PdxA, partial [Campylobacter jejuni]|nr:4-hydroxythreonine-4-phosphate dehydrogenase PdxA [Campylobacter jejuni]
LLGFNPHAGDYGVIGGEEEKIMEKAIAFVNLPFTLIKRMKIFKKALKDENLQKELLLNFKGKGVYLPYPLVADTAFTKTGLKNCNRLVAMYHDLALAPLK